jgi:hypothetical protein
MGMGCTAAARKVTPSRGMETDITGALGRYRH